MNRIKAKTLKGVWEYGYYIRTDLAKIFHHYIMPQYASDIYGIEIMPETICRESKFRDSNHTIIYENDIVELLNNQNQLIQCVCKYGRVIRDTKSDIEVEIEGFYFENLETNIKSFPIVNNYCGKHDTEIMKIIGNILD